MPKHPPTEMLRRRGDAERVLRALVVKGVVEETTRRADSLYANVVSSLVVRHSCPAAAALRARTATITLPFAAVPDKTPTRYPLADIPLLHLSS